MAERHNYISRPCFSRVSPIDVGNMCTKILTYAIEETNLPFSILRFATQNKTTVLSRKQFAIEFDPDKFNRCKHVDLETEIEKIWSNEKLRNPKLYNQKKFRFSSINTSENTICLNLGETCYRDIVATTRHENFGFWQAKGEKKGDAQMYRSNGIGVGILAFSSDNQLIVTRRADWTAEYPGLLDRPGGHPEPDNVFLDDGSLKRKGCYDVNEAVADELWSSPKDELEAEVGIGKESTENVHLMGIIFNNETGGRPSLEFVTRTRNSSETILEEYLKSNHTEADESSSLHLLSRSRVRILLEIAKQKARGGSSLIDGEAEDLFKQFTPALQGALLLYGELDL